MGSSEMDKVSRDVKALYEDHPYPDLPLPGIGVSVGGDPSVDHVQLWPEGRPRAPRILSVGCGTIQAVLLARENPECHVIGIDLSKASLAIAEQHKRRLGLRNLELINLDLLDIGSLGMSFDLIFCTGVFHHMNDPKAGVKMVASVMAPGSIIVAMLYGKAKREGVYLLQDAFSRLKLDRNNKLDLSFARSFIEALPEYHYFRHLTGPSGFAGNDAELVDMLLHPQDKAYSVAEVLEFADRSGLTFQGWLYPGQYSPDILAAGEVADRIRTLSLRDQWCVIEDVTMLNATHSFLLTNRKYDFATDSESVAVIQASYPVAGPQVHMIDGSKNIFENNGLRLEMTKGERQLLADSDGTKTVREIVSNSRFVGIPDIATIAHRFFVRMANNGYIFLSKVPSFRGKWSSNMLEGGPEL